MKDDKNSNHSIWLSQLAAAMRHGLAGLMLLSLPVCAIASSPAVPIEGVSNQTVAFRGLSATPKKDGLLVTGTVRRTSVTMGAIWGHLHVTATIIDGPPVSVDTRWSGNLSGRNYRSSPFSAFLPGVKAEQVQSISVAYRAGADAPQ